MPSAMTETDDIVARLNEEALKLLKRNHSCAGWLMLDAAAHITRLEERCAALTGQVEAGAEKIKAAEDVYSENGRMLYARAEAAERERDEALEIKQWAKHRAEAAERENAALKEEVGRLREALEKIEAWEPATQEISLATYMAEAARAALQPQGPKP